MSRDPIGDIAAELDKASDKFHDFHSFHEGLGVIAEEYHELIDAIRSNNVSDIRKEAIQVAAMCARLIRDCCDSEPPKHGLRREPRANREKQGA